MPVKLFMGVDIGTSGVRAVLFDTDGNQKSLSYKEYPMLCSEPGMAELDPDRIFKSFLTVVRECIDSTNIIGPKIVAVGFSTQLFSIAAVGRDGDCLTNVFTWADTRPIFQADRIKENCDYERIYNNTGCRGQHPMYPLSKILWLKDSHPDVYRKTFKFVSIKEYILFRLFGRYVIDITDASTTACFNIHNFEWDKFVLKDILGVSTDMFGEPVECTYVLTGIKEEYAGLMGLDRSTPFVAGSGDGMLANVGCGVFDDTSMSCTIGTSGALRITAGKPLLDSKQRTWCYCFTKDTWVAGGAINNGGIVLKWLCDQFKDQFDHDREVTGDKSVYELFDRFASEISPGSDGLIFLPLLTGE